MVKVGNFHETNVGLLAKVKIFMRRVGAVEARENFRLKSARFAGESENSF